MQQPQANIVSFYKHNFYNDIQVLNWMFLQCPDHFFHVIVTSLWRKEVFSFEKFIKLYYLMPEQYTVGSFQVNEASSFAYVGFFYWFGWPQFLSPFPVHTASPPFHLVFAYENAEDRDSYILVIWKRRGTLWLGNRGDLEGEDLGQLLWGKQL